ncbi:MAG: ATP-binding cassette domain-containing protein [Deltaproteobacteria bacterium]|nr:ATP-binding cassette domain-containing protein [Deltaproteobacteria bacterium]
MALIGVRDLNWGFSNPPLLENITFQIEKGERVGLLGRNGAGKSTLLRLLQGEILPDSGQVWRQQGLTVAYLSQSVSRDFEGSIFEVVAGGLGPKGKALADYRRGLKMREDRRGLGPPPPANDRQHPLDFEDWWTLVKQVETVLSRTQLPLEGDFADLSAGMKRRTENFIVRYLKTLLFVTHDRAFLKKLATRILELDRGRLFSYTCDYETFLKRRQAFLETEENQTDRFDKKLSQEEAWIRQGIKARRTRNEGRVAALIKMREAFQARRKKIRQVKLQIQEAERTGKLVIEAEHISLAFGETPVVRDFSTIILRGDKVGLIGPNGAGKTTLLNLLLKKIPPQTGRVRHGTHLQIAYFDQLRLPLDEEKTVLENVGEGRDFIELNGQRRHLIGYLQDFLFSAEKSRTPVKVLSGGEKNRLMLAKLFTRPANVLVLDEPTNDLDLETLELLEELLFEYQGTLLLVSHDRTFLNNVVASTMAFEEQGRVIHYAGGYDDWLIQRPPLSNGSRTDKKDRGKKAERPKLRGLPKLGYKEKRELEDLPRQINVLETERKGLFEVWSDPLFYKKGKEETERIKTRLAQVEEAIETAYLRWEELEGMA